MKSPACLTQLKAVLAGDVPSRLHSDYQDKTNWDAMKNRLLFGPLHMQDHMNTVRTSQLHMQDHMITVRTSPLHKEDHTSTVRTIPLHKEDHTSTVRTISLHI